MPDIDWSDTRIIQPEHLAGLTDDDFRAPDVVGVAEGWRAWDVNREPPPYGTAPKMYSATHSYYWAPRVKARAICLKAPDHVPGERCHCGFYSAKDLKHLRQMGYSLYDENSDKVTIVGQLANWGKVIEGSQGWRSEYAYPMKLYIPFEAWRLARPLMRAYGVKAELLNLLDPNAVPGQGRQIHEILERRVRPTGPMSVKDVVRDMAGNLDEEPIS
jgi:hypothetical protein